MTEDEYVAAAPAGIRDVLESSLATHRREKEEIVKLITENEANAFTEDELKAKKLGELRNLAALAGIPEPKKPALNFGGQGDPANVTDNKMEPLVAPTMDFSKKRQLLLVT
jgi:hypothetical protein